MIVNITIIIIFFFQHFIGAGPEHSSSTPERFLQMCDDEPNPTGEKDAEAITNPAQQLFEINWIVISPSVPATYFHALRRQVIKKNKINEYKNKVYYENNISHMT